MGALPRDPHRFRDMRNRHLLDTNTFDQQQPAVKRQTGVTVTHEDLRLVKTAISTAPEVFFQINSPSPTSRPSTPRRV